MKDANGNEIPEKTPEESQTTSNAPVSQPAPNQGNSTDWEAQYKGLQGTYNKLFINQTDLQNKYNAEVEAHEKDKQELARVQGELSKLQATLGDKDKSLLETQTNVESKARQYERLKTIAQKYPMLINLELNGLIPDINQEELDTKLGILNETIMKQIDNQTMNVLKNTPPSGTKNSAQMPPVNDIDSVFERLNVLAGSKDPKDQAEYEKLFSVYIDLKNKK